MFGVVFWCEHECPGGHLMWARMSGVVIWCEHECPGWSFYVSTNVRPCQKSRGNECPWERMSGIPLFSMFIFKLYVLEVMHFSDLHDGTSEDFCWHVLVDGNLLTFTCGLKLVDMYLLMAVCWHVLVDCNLLTCTCWWQFVDMYLLIAICWHVLVDGNLFLVLFVSDVDSLVTFPNTVIKKIYPMLYV